MSAPIISLIIPVYNVENYLVKSLSSVESQIFENFEAIIIDDGSTDNSPEIIKEFCRRNSNFKYVRQKNKGPASARNTGLSIAKGSYICFLDSDDYLEPSFLNSLYSNALKYDADIVCCNFNFYNPKKNLKTANPFHSLSGVYSKTQALRKLLLDVGIHYFVWNKLYKKKLFSDNNISFENMYFEDISISPKLFYYAKTVVITDDSLYNYTSRDTSILHSINAIKINDYIKSIGIIRVFLESKNDYKTYSNFLWIYAQKVKVVCYYYILNLHTKTSNFKDFFNNISAAMRSIDWFTSKDFICNSKYFEIPYTVKQPKVKIRKL